MAATGGKRIVLSTHDFEGVPADLIERVRAMRAARAEIVKVAVMARSLSDNLRLLQLERAPNTVLIGMGPAGAPTRVLAAHFHSLWSYAGDGYAPGQISAARMLDEFRFREITDQTAIYGVVGSPLTHSVSPAMHNAAFRAAGVDAVYVPLVASSAEDFTIFATALGVQGVSITIPYKVGLFERADEARRAQQEGRRGEHLSARRASMGGAQHRRQRFSRAAEGPTASYAELAPRFLAPAARHGLSRSRSRLPAAA